MPAGADLTPVTTLQRWEDSGALWRVLVRDGDSLSVGLFRCDGGEEVDRVTSEDPELRRFVGGRESSEE